MSGTIRVSDDTYCSVPSESSVDDIAVTVLLTAFHTSADPLRSLTTASRVSEIHALSAYPHCLRFNQDGSVSLLNIPGFLAKNRLPEWVPQSHTLRSLRQSLFCPLRVLSVYPESYQAFKKKHRSPLRTVPNPKISLQLIPSWIKCLIQKAYTAGAGGAIMRVHGWQAKVPSLYLVLGMPCEAAGEPLTDQVTLHLPEPPVATFTTPLTLMRRMQ